MLLAHVYTYVKIWLYMHMRVQAIPCMCGQTRIEAASSAIHPCTCYLHQVKVIHTVTKLNMPVQA
jgi:hypothetical protein